jgi:hypothetical protein
VVLAENLKLFGGKRGFCGLVGVSLDGRVLEVVVGVRFHWDLLYVDTMLGVGMFTIGVNCLMNPLVSRFTPLFFGTCHMQLRNDLVFPSDFAGNFPPEDMFIGLKGPYKFLASALPIASLEDEFL